MKVVILSAGQGRRLSPLTDHKPKCLIELSGRSTLAWQLENLRACGVTDAVVVTGFGAGAVDAEIAGLNLSGMTVRTRFNPFFAVSDNLATCWLVRDEFSDGMLVLNGDTLFDPAVAQRLLAAPAADITVAIDRKASYDDDDMRVLTEGETLKAIGKTITEYNAESIGFLRFSPAGGALFADYLDRVLRQPDNDMRWYLSVIDLIARETGRVRAVSIEGLGWAEMDFPADMPRNLALTERWAARALAG